MFVKPAFPELAQSAFRIREFGTAQFPVMHVAPAPARFFARLTSFTTCLSFVCVVFFFLR